VWLKGVIRHKITDVWRAIDHARASGFSGDPDGAARLADPHRGPADEFEARFEDEWKKVALEEALAEIRREVDPATYQAFDLYVLQNQPVGDVAKLLGLSRNAVYIAKTRIQDRLRRMLVNQRDG
jgi:DNA-directed RNA polymerase specialized sigma24 family protein